MDVQMYRVVLVEDNEMVSKTISHTLSTATRYQLVSAYDRCEDALQYLDHDMPDIVLMDIRLLGMNGIEGTSRIKKKLPRCIVLILTAAENDELIFSALKAGAVGYILKDENIRRLIPLLDEALAGGAPMSPSVARMVVQSFQRQQDSPLSEREVQVMQGVAEGKSYTRIADDLFLSKETIKSHIKNIFQKLDVNNKADAIRVVNARNWI
ncbi:response regulator transcription factor [Chitinophaga flava]|uniref:DNA-binding response regulator n=1 Tax=Chitinophaga flava TaxID=2259036 RepID=A0A365Y0C1_9BACT|nr:response regulator transcription factor [Chitinophaga flava]RBL92049.1 DNA-binding response regulator [Chitinophaga flava]